MAASLATNFLVIQRPFIYITFTFFTFSTVVDVLARSESSTSAFSKMLKSVINSCLIQSSLTIGRCKYLSVQPCHFCLLVWYTWPIKFLGRVQLTVRPYVKILDKRILLAIFLWHMIVNTNYFIFYANFVTNYFFHLFYQTKVRKNEPYWSNYHRKYYQVMRVWGL